MTLLVNHGIYAISDCINYPKYTVLEKTEIILKKGATLFQYRDKENPFEYRITFARDLQVLCKQYNVPFIINDDLQLTKEISADGIHLGRHDQNIKTARKFLGPVIIGISCYNEFDRALHAKNSGADYLTFGSFYPSPTKPDAVIANVNLLARAKEEIDLPIVAIGGITPENGRVLIRHGADYLAVISGLYSTQDTEKMIKKYTHLFL